MTKALDDRLQPVSIRLTLAQALELKRRGGGKYVRTLLDKPLDTAFNLEGVALPADRLTATDLQGWPDRDRLSVRRANHD